MTRQRHIAAYASNATAKHFPVTSTALGYLRNLRPTFAKAWSLCALLGLVSFFAPTIGAIESGSTINTSNPGNPPWNYVGSVNGCGGVYLGSYNGTYWVLTAAHVGLGDFTLGDTAYNAISGSAFSIHNSDGSQADLCLFQISRSPGLANLTIASTAPNGGATVEMIGFGGGKSWGINTIYGYIDYTLGNTPYGGTGILTLASGEGGNGAQAISGDSGGGMFHQTSGTTWELVGTLSGAGDVSINGTDLGQGTVSADLADYSGQIAANIDSVAFPKSTDTPTMPVWSLAALGVLLPLAGMRFLPRDHQKVQ